MTLAEVLRTQPMVLLDGAMGTELHRRGVDVGLPLWSANALIHEPETVLEIHREYLQAGADVITTNTFRTNIRTLKRKNYDRRWIDLNTLAVQLAHEACNSTGKKALVAGSIATVEDCYSPHLVPSNDELREEHREQVRLLASLDVNFLLLETMNTIREAVIAAEACRETGAEFAVSFVTDTEDSLLSGESLEHAVEAVLPCEPAAIMVNCVSAKSILNPLKIGLARATIPVGCYANVGTPVRDGTHMHREVTLDEYGDYAMQWIASGARLVGGCCGTTPAFISFLRERFFTHELHTFK